MDLMVKEKKESEKPRKVSKENLIVLVVCLIGTSCIIALVLFISSLLPKPTNAAGILKEYLHSRMYNTSDIKGDCLTFDEDERNSGVDDSNMKGYYLYTKEVVRKQEENGKWVTEKENRRVSKALSDLVDKEHWTEEDYESLESMNAYRVITTITKTENDTLTQHVFYGIGTSYFCTLHYLLLLGGIGLIVLCANILILTTNKSRYGI